MTCQISSAGICSSFWDSTPIGRSINLCLCQHEQLSPQLILEDKVFRSQNNSTYHSQIHFIGTLISDDESQRLTYVIDRLLLTNDIHNHQSLTGEFLIPIHCDNQSSIIRNNLIQDGIKEIDTYCHSSLPMELYRFLYLCGHISSRHSSSINANLSFDLLTIKNTFTLTPINPDYVQIIPTALLKNLCTSTRNNVYMNQPHFGYCSLDRMSEKKILLILENDPQVCTLPLVGIWISGIIDIQCTFVWAACLRYCMNSSLKQRLRSGINPQQSFLLACYLPTSYDQGIFYEVYSTSLQTIDYDLWTCSKQIMIPNLSSSSSNIQFPYDFKFKRVYNESKNYLLSEVHSGNPCFPIHTRFPTDISFRSAEIPPDDHQVTLSLPNTNGSLFGIPRLPPRQSSRQSPSWDSIATTLMTTPKQIVRSSNASPKSRQFSSSAPSATVIDTRWKEEFIERMKSYETHIQSLTALVTQLLTTEQHSISTPVRECTKRDVAIQSEPSSPCINVDTDQPLSILNNNRYSSQSPKIEQCQQQTSIITATNTPLTSPIVHQQEPILDNPFIHKSPPTSSIPTDLNPVDILKPIFQFIDNQQQRQQQGSASSLMTTYNSTDAVSSNINNQETDYQTENMFHLANVIQEQEQHVTSTRMTGISFISNGVQMQFINQQSSTTTVYPQSQSAPPPPPPPTVLLPTSPQISENNLSIEVHGLEMKYLEDDQLAVAIECDRQSQTPQIVDKSLSFGTQEYLRRYDLLTDSNS